MSRLVPHQFKMRDESRRENDVDRAVTTNLVGDENITTLGIFGRWQHGAALYGVNRRSNLTPHRRPILTPLGDGFWR